MSWKATSLHFITFGDALSAPDAVQPWQRAFGGFPQQLLNAAIGQPPSSVASGIVGDYQFVINSNPGRSEVVLSPGAQPIGPPEAIGDWKTALDVLQSHALLASAQCNANRVAIVANFSEQVDTPAQATELFIKHVSLNTVPAGALDLNFGFNLPKPIQGVNGQINRLCRWGTGILQYVGMQMNMTGAAPIISVHVNQVATLQIDVSTSVFDLSSDDLRGNIIELLASEVGSIAVGGYDYLVS